MIKYDLSVFIGRFQPFHVGHLHNIRKALTVSDRLILLIGSSSRAPSIKNPFSFEQRKAMIEADLLLTDIDIDRVIIEPLRDYYYDEQAWLDNVKSAVTKHQQLDQSVAIVGHEKDGSSYYLKSFPQWGYVNVSRYHAYNATDFRNAYFNEGEILESYMVADDASSGSYALLEAFKQAPLYQLLCDEYYTIAMGKKAWSMAPYSPVFVTTDALVVADNKILLIQRKFSPGKGLWALPGGFLDQDEYVVDGILRELIEETEIDLSAADLQSALKLVKVFDYPERSLRGRTITHAGLFDLGGQLPPSVKAADDAANAQWFDLSFVIEGMEAQMMDDHHQIIIELLKHKNAEI